MKNKNKPLRRWTYDVDQPFEKIKSPSHKWYPNDQSDEEKPKHVIFDTTNFKCLHCGAFISSDRDQSGVNNRNHCPYCLWSRHVDKYKPGDRRSECKSRMEPLGLTLKQNLKKYGSERQGELMLIHRCIGCGKYSINRIAADDDSQKIYNLFLMSENNGELRACLETHHIFMLTSRDLTIVHAQLYGVQSLLEEFSARDGFIPSQVKLEDNPFV